MISGYLITSILLKSKKVGFFEFILQFYKRRIKRLLPALVVVMGAVLLVGWFVLDSVSYHLTGVDAFATSVFASNLRFLTERFDYFASGGLYRPLQHMWSLAIEEQFYLLWPLLVFWASQKIKWVALGVTLLSFGFYWYATQTAPIHSFYNPLARFWEISAGALIACFGWRLGFSKLAHSLKGVFPRLFLAALCILLFFPNSFLEQKFLYNPLIVALSALVLVVPATLPQSISSKLGYVGRISYPLYLWHWPLFVYLKAYYFDSIPTYGIVAGIAASFVLSIFTYHFVEFQKRKFQWKPILALATAYGAFAGFGLALRFYSGFPVREQVIDTASRSYFFDSVLGTRFDDKKYIDNLNPLNHSFPKEFKRCESEEQGSGPSKIEYCAHHISENSAQPNLFLIGDSHALVYFKAMTELWDGNVTLYSSSGLPVVMNSTYDDLLARFGKESQLRDYSAQSIHILAQLSKKMSNSNNILVFIQRQELLIEGYQISEKHVPLSNALARKIKEDFNLNLKFYANNFIYTIKLLTQNGGHVFLVKDNPIHEKPGWPLSCGVRSLWRDFSTPNQQEECLKFRPKTSYLAQLESILHQIETEAQKSQLPFALLDPLPNLCSNGICNALYENKLLYRDDDHLSHDGARLGARKIISDISAHLESFRHKNALSSR